MIERMSLTNRHQSKPPSK